MWGQIYLRYVHGDDWEHHYSMVSDRYTSCQHLIMAGDEEHDDVEYIVDIQCFPEKSLR